MNAEDWIQRLNMKSHPEGGWYVESFRDAHQLQEKSASTAIYFLLLRGEPSHFHRIRSAEMWHFYAGSPLIVHQLRTDEGYKEHRVGRDWEDGYRFQSVVPPMSWFAAESLGDFSLVGCTVAPGFEFADFELAKGEELVRSFPKYQDLIDRLTR
jgi:predicted cupin superfamily sugar epimerase